MTTTRYIILVTGVLLACCSACPAQQPANPVNITSFRQLEEFLEDQGYSFVYPADLEPAFRHIAVTVYYPVNITSILKKALNRLPIHYEILGKSIIFYRVTMEPSPSPHNPGQGLRIIESDNQPQNERPVAELDSVFVQGKNWFSYRLSATGTYTVSKTDLGRQTNWDVFTGLKARIPGLYIREYNGVAGSAEGIVLGSRHSIQQSNEPLIILDGVPLATSGFAPSVGLNSAQGLAGAGPLNFIVPADIAQIEILQGIAATALYGSRASNGVIRITRKEGTRSPLRLSLEVSGGLQRTVKTSPLLSTAQFLQLRREAVANDGMPVNAQTLPEAFLWDSTQNDFRQLSIGHPATIWNTGLQATGGGFHYYYLFSGQLQRESTTFPGSTSDERRSFYGHWHQESRDSRWQFSSAFQYAGENNLLPVTDYARNQWLAPNAPAPYDNISLLTQNVYLAGMKDLLAHLSVHYKVTNHISLEAAGGYNGSSVAERVYLAVPAQNTTRHHQLELLSGETQAHYRADIGPGDLTISLGAVVHQQQMEVCSLTGRLSADAALSYMHTASFGELSYILKKRYILFASLRRESSTPDGLRMAAGNFWSLGGAWIFYSASVTRPLDYGKIRGSIGTSGNEPAIGLDGTFNTPFNPRQPFWERNLRQEMALEFNLLHNHLWVSLGGYRNLATNQWLTPSFATTPTPIGILYNEPGIVVGSTALEFQLKVKECQLGPISWTSTLSLTAPRSRLLHWPGLEASNYAGEFIIGQSPGSSLVWHSTGVDPQTGVYTFQTKNADGLPGQVDKVPGKGLDPYYYAGWSQQWRYRNWEFAILLDYRRQPGINPLVTLARQNPPGMQGVAQLSNGPVEWLDHWRKPGDNAHQQRLTAGADALALQRLQYFLASDAATIDASFLRLGSCYLGWSMPSSIANRWGLSECRLFLTGQNLFTHTHFPVADPETQDPFVLPPLRSLVAGVRLGF